MVPGPSNTPPLGTKDVTGGPPPTKEVGTDPIPLPSSAPNDVGSATSNEAAVIRRFLEKSGVLSSNDVSMSIAEMGSYVRGRVAR